MRPPGGESPSGMHVDDEFLARFLDSELSRREREEWEAHAGVCPECRDAAAALRHAAGRFTDTIVKADVDVPLLHLPIRREASFWTRRNIAIAAGVAGILLTLSISPTRAWISSSLADVRDRLWDRDRVSFVEEGGTPGPAAAPNAVRVSIPLSRNVLSIQVAARQQSGSMTFHVVEGRGAFAEIVDGGPEELVVADGLRVLNVAQSTSSYVITVPVHVSRVTLRIGDDVESQYDVSEAGQSWVVDFDPE